MPKRKITLDEAFAVFEQHGLQVEVKAVQQNPPTTPLSEFLEPVVADKPAVQQTNKKTVKITLFAAHSVGNGGEVVTDVHGNKTVINNGIQTYGPGVCVVPISLAQHLLHQDLLAREADERMLERTMRNYVITPYYTKDGVMVNRAVNVAQDNNFDMSGFLGRLGDNNILHF